MKDKARGEEMRLKHKKKSIIFIAVLILFALITGALIAFNDIGSMAYGGKQCKKAADKAVEVPHYKTTNVMLPKNEIVTPTATPYKYPYNTLDIELGSDELCGFKEYYIPSVQKQSGGELPLIVQQYLYSVCKSYDFDYATALAVIETESGYRWDTVSSCGAVGYMQVIPKHHSERMDRFGVTDISNPFQNIVVGIDYLSELQGRFKNMDKALTAYTYGVTGAYRHVWNAGLDSCEYSRKVKKAAKRIRKKLRKN